MAKPKKVKEVVVTKSAEDYEAEVSSLKEQVEQLEASNRIRKDKIDYLEGMIREQNDKIEYLELPFYQRWFLKVFAGTL